MKKQGCTYAKIAEEFSIPRSTIKTYCHRTHTPNDVAAVKPVCKQCGCPIESKEKHRPRQFCSDKCRCAWWYANHSNTPKTEYHLTCACCGKPFVSSGNKTRKYCAHECYITARFGSGGNKLSAVMQLFCMKMIPNSKFAMQKLLILGMVAASSGYNRHRIIAALRCLSKDLGETDNAIEKE